MTADWGSEAVMEEEDMLMTGKGRGEKLRIL
jgi:hypothetical protein